MSGRVFFTPQQGRTDKSKNGEDEPWGMTASQSQFRAFEPSEARDARGGPRVPMEPSHPGSRLGSTVGGRAPSAASKASSKYLPAATASAFTVASSRNSSGSKLTKTNLNTLERSIPERPFLGTSSYADHQNAAQEARHAYFPYRDEFAPRSKRLLYEMAHAKLCQEDDVKSETKSHADSVSCFTIASTGVHSAAKQSSVARSSSEPNILTLPRVGEHARVPTADSQKVTGGVARRRKQLELRAPAQWKPDHEWVHNTILEEGPAGLAYANHRSSMHHNNMKQFGEHMNAVSNIMHGFREKEFTK